MSKSVLKLKVEHGHKIMLTQSKDESTLFYTYHKGFREFIFFWE